MADAILLKGGVGGVDCDSATATAADIIDGKTAGIAGSDDLVTGNLQDMAGYTQVVSIAGSNTGSGLMYIYIPKGAYRTAGGNKVYPEVTAKLTDFGTAGPGDVRSGHNFTSKHGLRIRGTAKEFSGNFGYADVYAPENDVRMWGFNGNQYAIIHVGQGIMAGNCNFIGSKQNDIRAENIKQGKTIFGITGTLADYQSGRVAFNGATFDSMLATGVATNKGFQFRTGYVVTPAGYKGIADGGLKLDYHQTGDNLRLSTSQVGAGVALSQSVQMTPFRTIRVGYKFTKVSVVRRCGISMRLGACNVSDANTVTPTSGYQIRGLYGPGNRSPVAECVHATSDITLNAQQYMDVDVSSLNAEAFVGIEVISTWADSYNNNWASISVVINHLEFIN